METQKEVNISAIARKLGVTRRYVQLVKSGIAGVRRTEKQRLIKEELGLN